MHLFQEATGDSLSTAAVQIVPVSAVETFSVGSLVDLADQAGGFQWPIFGVLVAGLLFLAVAFVRILFDWRAARSLYRLTLPDLLADDLQSAVAQSADNLYARLAVGMMELWGGGADAATLGQEAARLIGSAGASYRRTERVITFLSSTAGGLGLLGTLVGIYMLFSSGARDAQTIFAGIGVAVISTLLGIIVTIVLELLEMLTGGWARRYLERAEAWATQLRYRLIAIEPGLTWSARPSGSTKNGRGTPTTALKVEKVGTTPNLVRPGQEVGPLGVRALVDGHPAEGVPVVFAIKAGEGCFSTGEQRLETTTTGAGMAAFTLRTGEEEGHNVVEAVIEGKRVRFSIPTRHFNPAPEESSP
ncbi:MAG: MotA/TolQ/ExbB proton channel family protein [Rhodothermales bacterium]